MNENVSVAEPRRRRVKDNLEIGLEEKEPPKRREPKPGPHILAKAHKLINEKIQEAIAAKGLAKVAVFTHPSPDPDAIGSQISLGWLLHKCYEANVEVDLFYDGNISHPQNQRMCNLLGPDLKLFTDCKPEDYDLRICVDTCPVHSACPENTYFDLVIDHHKEIPNGGFKGLFVNLKCGSCCSTVYQLIKEFGIPFEEDNDIDSKVATSLIVGILTDTDNQTSDDTTDCEHQSYQELFEFRNSTALNQILRYKQPREWVEARAECAQKAHDRIKDGVLIHGIGFITGSNRDLIAAVADEMLSWENVETCVAFAVIDGQTVAGSVRSSNAAVAVPSLCKDLGGQYGGGGGKLGKGAYYYSLGSLSLDQDSEDSCKEKLWDCIKERELKRLYKAVKK